VVVVAVAEVFGALRFEGFRWFVVTGELWQYIAAVHLKQSCHVGGSEMMMTMPEV